MGVFQQWQPIYAAHNVPTFPVRGDTKRPAVKGYLKVGPQVSERFADKFGGYDAFGFALKRAGITVLDVDTPDERVLADALDRHGQTPLVIRTGSGNWQAYYRNRGEGRRIRPWSGKPIDVLGDGFTIAPPSKGALGWYAFVQGTLDDLDRLPSIKGLAVPGEAPAATPNKPERIAIAKGQRNRELFRFCMSEARSCASLDELVDRAAAYADTSLVVSARTRHRRRDQADRHERMGLRRARRKLVRQGQGCRLRPRYARPLPARPRRLAPAHLAETPSLGPGVRHRERDGRRPQMGAPALLQGTPASAR